MSNASEYAESVGRGFWSAFEAGAVFGTRCVDCESTDADCGCGVEREPVDVYTWLEDVLDIDLVVSIRGDYKGAEVLVSFGGPNAWVDTRENALVVAWGSERASWALPSAMIVELDDALEGLWAGLRG
jgi:hypothetical protein